MRHAEHVEMERPKILPISEYLTIAFAGRLGYRFGHTGRIW